MTQYEWIFVIDDLVDDTIDAVYSTCDALVSQHAGLTLLTITTEGSSALEAAKTTIVQLQDERRLVRFQRPYEDFVTKAEIAARCNSTPQAVGQWARGKRQREFPFPECYNLTAGGIWLWGEVNQWLRGIGKSSDDIEHPGREDYATVNHWIRERRAIDEFATSSSGWIYPIESAIETDTDPKRPYDDSITDPDFHLVPSPTINARRQ